MDRDLGTGYHPRFLEYLKTVQRQDLSAAGALTEPRGERNKKTLEWPDPYLSLKMVDKNKDGIVVRGAKFNISGAYASHELVVLPPLTRRRESRPKTSRSWATRSTASVRLQWLSLIMSLSPGNVFSTAANTNIPAGW